MYSLRMANVLGHFSQCTHMNAFNLCRTQTHTQINKRHNFQENSTCTQTHTPKQSPHRSLCFLVVWANLGTVYVCKCASILSFYLKASTCHRTTVTEATAADPTKGLSRSKSSIRKIKGRRHRSIHWRTGVSALRMHNQCISSFATERDGQRKERQRQSMREREREIGLKCVT